MEVVISVCYFPLLDGMGAATADEWIQLSRLTSWSKL